jgi:hypothetical protein
MSRKAPPTSSARSLVAARMLVPGPHRVADRATPAAAATMSSRRGDSTLASTLRAGSTSPSPPRGPKRCTGRVTCISSASSTTARYSDGMGPRRAMHTGAAAKQAAKRAPACEYPRGPEYYLRGYTGGRTAVLGRVGVPAKPGARGDRDLPDRPDAGREGVERSRDRAGDHHSGHPRAHFRRQYAQLIKFVPRLRARRPHTPDVANRAARPVESDE